MSEEEIVGRVKKHICTPGSARGAWYEQVVAQDPCLDRSRDWKHWTKDPGELERAKTRLGEEIERLTATGT
jgi:hypothetical protein